MTGGDQRSPDVGGLPSPPANAPSAADPPPWPAAFAPDSPELPVTDAAAPISMADGSQPTRGSATWYRTDQDRYKSVRRRANPWYRRITRGLIALSLISLLGVGLYFGGREVQDYLDRDRLPGPGTDIPDFRATSFQLQSAAPAPEVDGTLTIDAVTNAFEFVGSGAQSGLQVVSPDGARVYIRRGSGEWQVAGGADPLARDLTTAVSYLADVDEADDILTNRLRQGYIELIDKTTEGVDDNELTRYEMTFDTAAFSDAYPLQWSSFRRNAIPGVTERGVLSVTIWIDTDDVLVRLEDTDTNWSWERLTYADQPFQPIDPAASLLDATTDDATTDDVADDKATASDGSDG